MSLSGKSEKKGSAPKRSHSEEMKESVPAPKRSHSEDMKESVPAPERSHSGHHDNKAKSSIIHQERSASTVPSCVSVKSDQSMGDPILFREGEQISTIHQERPAYSVPSCVSMKSDQSMGDPILFREGEQIDQQERSESKILSGESAQSHQTHLTSIFTLLEQNIMTFIKKELKRFKTKLSSGVPEGFDGKRKDEEVVDSEDGKQESSAKEGALKITLHFLRNMNQKELADALEESELSTCQHKLKSDLMTKFQNVFEGMAKQGNPTLLNKIYTELYITEGGSGEVNYEHEVRQIETTTRKQARPETAIKCNDIFKPLPGQDKLIRTVLTKGVAGIGKTVSVQKFILDWAEGKANQDIQFIFSLPFRDLNVIKGEKHSLIKLLNCFSNESIISNYDKYKVVLIFDGLDESRLPLDFKNNESVCDVTESTSVDVLLTNLIRGNLLPSALLWITTRPAAANRIPSECVDQVTEVRGFNDPQKEEYFRKRFSDEDLANRIISHIKTSRSLHIMCHIPVFCWISATVLEHMLTDMSEEMPKTLTEMYIHLVVFHTKQKDEKYHGKEETKYWNKDSILKLGKLAFEQLEKGNLIFYKKDLKECGLGIDEASVYSGVCTQTFREECGLYQDKVYCFVHLSIQEFLAAVYVFLSFTNNNTNILVKPQSTSSNVSIHSRENAEVTFFRNAVDEALKSKTGHLDLFLRFLLGLSLKSNQKHLQRLLTKTRTSSQSRKETVNYIKEKIRENPSSDRCINLFHCLNEMNDHSLVEEIQWYLSSGSLSRQELSPAQWSALVFVLLTSEEEIDVFDLKKYSTSEGLLQLLPVVKSCRAALMSGCGITEKGCVSLISALKSYPSALKKLDLSSNHPGDSGISLLSAELKDPHWRLESLRLAGCNLTYKSCETLASALQTPNCPLRELDLSYNPLEDRGVTLLCAGPTTPLCNIQTFVLGHCGLTEGCCSDLASVLNSPNTQLKQLELKDNDLQDLGVTLLSAGLEDPHCKLLTLGLSACLVTAEGCASLVSALRSNPSHLKELDLSYNHPGDSGVRLLTAGLEDPQWRLEKLNLNHGGECWLKSGLKKYFCDLTLDPNTVNRKLSLSEENRKVSRSEEQPYPDHPERFEEWPQVLCREGLTGRCYWEVEWTGNGAVLAVTYKGINRRGGGVDCRLGYNEKTWSLYCCDDSYSAYHNKKGTFIPVISSGSHRVGVYLDWPSSTLSFYRVSSDTLTLLYKFHTTFTEPLYPGFRVYESSVSSVSLCQGVPVSNTK